MKRNRLGKFPPDTKDPGVLAEFFEQVDLTDLEGLEETDLRPERELVQVSLRLPREDVETFKKAADKAGVGHTTFMRMVLRRYVNQVRRTGARTQ